MRLRASSSARAALPSEVLAAWCETRRDFRHFRLDRIRSAQALDEGYPKRRRLLLAEWRLEQDIETFG